MPATRTYSAFGRTRTTRNEYSHAALHCDHRVTFHATEVAARRTGGAVEPAILVEGRAPREKTWPAIECGRCGKTHTTLKCDGCGF